MILTLFLALVFMALYSRYKLKVIEGVSGKKQSFSDQFSLGDDTTNFDKYLNDNKACIKESKNLMALSKKAKLYYWLQGGAGAVLVIQFIVYAIYKIQSN